MNNLQSHKVSLPQSNELIELSSHPRLFHGIILVCMLGALIIGFMQLHYGVPANRLFAVGCIFLIGICSEILAGMKWYRAAYVTLIWGVWCAVTIQAVMRGGLANPGLYLYPVVILMSGWLIGTGHAFSALLASSMSLILIGLSIELQVLEPTVGLSAILQGMTMAVILILCYTALQFFLSNHWSDLQSIQKLNNKLGETIKNLTQSEAKYRLLNEELEIRVTNRTAALSAALSELEHTKEELVQAGKLLALGKLVTGVAHELNTPIGNALVAASTLGDSAREIQRAYFCNQIKRSQLENFLKSVSEGSELIQQSLFRSSELVRSFKQVAIDQSSEKRQVFELKVALEDIAATLLPNFKHEVWELKMKIPDTIKVDGYFGALEQIVTNLLANASVHAFDVGQPGVVRINATLLPDDSIELVCVDDGKGIDAKILPRVFEPFFTTRLGQGGSGLGLAIAQRLANKVLGGTLSAESEFGKGALFRLRFPRVAPDLC